MEEFMPFVDVTVVGEVAGGAAAAGAALLRPRKDRHIELSEEPLPRLLRSFVRGGAMRPSD